MLPNPNFKVVDDDVGDMHTFSINGGDYADYFAIDSLTGILEYDLNYDLDERILPTQLRLTITVHDTAGLSSSVQLEMVIDDVNDNPPVLDSDNYVITLDVSTPVGLSMLSVAATDLDSGKNGAILFKLDQTSLENDMFAVSNNGEIYLSSSHKMAPGSHLNFTILAYNQQNSSQAHSALVQVIVKEKALIDTTDHGDLTQANFFDEPENIGIVSAGLLAFVAALIAISCLLAKYCCRNKAEETKVIIR